MEKFISFVLSHKKGIVIFFLSITLVCAVSIFGVNQNYSMSDYLPSSAQSTKAIEIMKEEFDGALPNASVMASGVSITGALEIKEKIRETDGVLSVLWLDDTVDIKKPVESYDSAAVEAYYKDGNALFSVSIESGKEYETVKALREIESGIISVSGEAANMAAQRDTSAKETLKAMAIICTAIIILLVLFSDSYFQPVLFIAAIGCSIVINMGTNIFFKNISYITFTISPILQLAVSLDYAVFLIHSFNSYKKDGYPSEDAMRLAVKKSMKAVAASAVTTLCGFAALSFMKFEIGADLGINLMKGIAVSFISCMIFLPALTLVFEKVLLKTGHKAFLPDFKGADSFFSKIRIPVVIIAVLIAIPCFLAENRVDFIYGNEEADEKSIAYTDSAKIKEAFGETNVIAVLVPKGDTGREEQLFNELLNFDAVTGGMSYSSAVGSEIPADFVPEDKRTYFYSENYSRLILYTNTKAEGEEAFSTVKNVNETVSKYYDEFYCAGESETLYDMKNIVSEDNLKVNIIVIVSILLVLLITFRSVSLPVVLILTIETGIWINLSVPYFTGTPLNFIGYLVISTVQLGATVDYAILYTSFYLDRRKNTDKKTAVKFAMGDSFKSTLLSGSTLCIAGLALYFSSSNPLISSLGMLLARGTVLSMLLVFCLLPALLKTFDKAIGKTTYKSKFLTGGEYKK